MSTKYSKAASQEVEKAVHDFKHKGKFKSRKQAIAVGLSKARQNGKQVPQKLRG